ncbi:MAG: hypothetical protein JWO04_3502 [Gammaproteobacteria bacterium]|nr:hypothetical protein [Gammaproteobacteria bacterium]
MADWNDAPARQGGAASSTVYTDRCPFLHETDQCRNQFGRDLVANIDPEDPIFHSLFNVQTIFTKFPGIPGVGSGLFDDTESLFTSRHKT